MLVDSYSVVDDADLQSPSIQLLLKNKAAHYLYDAILSKLDCVRK